MPLDRCRMLDLPRIRDARGSLTALEGGVHVPFPIARVYYLYDLPDGAFRGGHAHRALEQVLIALHGSFQVHLDDGRRQASCRLERGDQGLYLTPGIWRELSDFRGGAVCLVLASAPYDESDYIRDHGQFLQAVAQGAFPA